MKITIELNEEELKGLIFGKEKPKETLKKRFEYDAPVYESRFIADDILENMKDIAQKYGYVSEAEFKDLSNGVTDIELPTLYTDNHYGWTLEMLRTRSHIVRVRSGYLLELPKPLPII